MIIHRDDMLEMACFGVPGQFPRHAHDEAVISINGTSHEEVRLDGHELEIRPGETTLYRPGQVQSSRYRAGTGERETCVSVYVDATAAEAIGLRVDFVRPVIRDPSVGRALRRLAGLSDPESRRQALLVLLAGLPTGAAPPRPLPPERLGPVFARLERDLGRTPPLTALSDLAGVSVEHLVRSFHAATGLPPHAWHVQRRIQRARQRLRAGEDVVAVALALGFADQAHFSKHFRRITGLTPGAYRRAINC